MLRCGSGGSQRTGSMHWEPIVKEGASLDFDCPCAGCGYNMRTVKPSGYCPECQRPVADALNALRREQNDDVRARAGAMTARGERWFMIIMIGGMINGILLMLFLVVLALSAPPGSRMSWSQMVLISGISILPFPTFLGFYKWVQWLSRRAFDAGACPECGYDRRGNDSLRCPECGAWLAPMTAAPSQAREQQVPVSRRFPLSWR